MKRRRKARENAENEVTKRENERENEEIEGEEDRLSDCPDSILVHILSLLNAKEAVQTCILSTRWKNLWKHLPTLHFNSISFKTFKAFTRFVTRILSRRDSSSELNTLTFQREGIVEPNLIKRMVTYALSHNVHRLALFCRIKDIQPSLFSSHTLKDLALDMCSGRKLSNVVVFPSNLNLPALTTLTLWSLAFRANENGRADPFSGFNRLNTLSIYYCTVLDGKTLSISNTMLIDLSLYPIPSEVDGENLDPKIDLYAPKLCTFTFEGTPFQNLNGSNLSSLEHLYIDSHWGDGNHLILLNWLIELAHIKSLTVSTTTLEVLFSGPHKLKVKLPSLCNLKILKVKPFYWVPVDWGNCFKMVNLLLQNAPFAEFCIEKRFQDWSCN